MADGPFIRMAVVVQLGLISAVLSVITELFNEVWY